MSIYVYRRAPSTGAQDLAEALDAVRFRARQRPIERAARRGDVIVAWGEHVPEIPGVRILNGGAIRSKYQDAIRLREAGIPTILVSQMRPAPEIPVVPVDPLPAIWQQVMEESGAFSNFPRPINLRNPVAAEAVRNMLTSFTALQDAMGRPAPVAVPVVQREWLPRMNNHVGGNDLLAAQNAALTPDFWVAKEDIIEEYRIHSFRQSDGERVSIRAGVKAPREGFGNLHPWIRSWDAGWRIRYDGVTARQAQRDLAHRAVEALGLDFGAVDIGKKRDNTLIVLEVNRAPGLREGTIDVYARAISNWIANQG